MYITLTLTKVFESIKSCACVIRRQTLRLYKVKIYTNYQYICLFHGDKDLLFIVQSSMLFCKHRMRAVVLVGALLPFVLSYILPVIVRPLTTVYGMLSTPATFIVGPFRSQRRNSSKTNIYMPEYSQVCQHMCYALVILSN